MPSDVTAWPSAQSWSFQYAAEGRTFSSSARRADRGISRGFLGDTPTAAQQSKTDQQMSFRKRWS